MFERETRREKILEARQRELRLKERSRLEGQEAEEEERLLESPQEVLDRVRRDFFEVIKAERTRAETQHLHGKVAGMGRTGHHGGDLLPWGRDTGQLLPSRLKSTQERRRLCRGKRPRCLRRRKRMPRLALSSFALPFPSSLRALPQGSWGAEAEQSSRVLFPCGVLSRGTRSAP